MRRIGDAVCEDTCRATRQNAIGKGMNARYEKGTRYGPRPLSIYSSCPIPARMPG